MYDIKPLKHLGQNFLTDKKVVKKIIKAANLKPTDMVLEIGPGLGALTKELVKKVKQVIACEKDPKMCRILKETLEDFRNIKIVNQDVLKITNYQLQTINYKLIANLPFYITSPVIRKFLETPNPPKEMILTVQKEVAQRICRKPPRMNLLAISVQFYAKPEIISYVSKESFWPQPKVDAAIIKIIPHQKYKKVNPEQFFKIVKAGFSHPRKQLANNLSEVLKLDKQKLGSLLLKNNIEPSQRAETLTIKDWLNLTKVL